MLIIELLILSNETNSKLHFDDTFHGFIDIYRAFQQQSNIWLNINLSIH